MNLKLLFTACCTVLLIASCSHDYEPALFHQDIVYMPKPASFDSVKSATYISGAFSYNINSNGNDQALSGQLNISEGHTFKHFNLAYGAFAIYGNYENLSVSSDDPFYFKSKYFGAVGARFAASTYFTSRNVDYRLLGVEAAYSSEYGAYAGYRDYLTQEQGFYVDNRTYLFSIGGTSEVVFHGYRNPLLQHGVYIFVGATTGTSPIDAHFYSSNGGTLYEPLIKAGYFFKFKHFFGSAEVGNMLFFRAGYAF